MNGGSSRRAGGRSWRGRFGVGILLGAKWAYEEVGWGGWYAWDPVENAALMPWLVATAFLHSVMVQEKKDMLRVWNVVLVALAFGLSLFGTFLTRSGVVNSIHSFTQSAIGPWFLGFIAVSTRRLPRSCVARLAVCAHAQVDHLSREGQFLYNNLFLVAFALDPLGRRLPDPVRGGARAAGHGGAAVLRLLRPCVRPPLVLLMGIGPLIAWRRASRALGAALVWPAASLVTGVALLVAGAGSSAAGLIGSRSPRSSSRRSSSSSHAGRARAGRFRAAAGSARSRA